MEAIVLAGGLGTRLRSVVHDLPKPMAPVHGRPFLAFVLDQLADAGFAVAVLAVGFRHEAITSHFGKHYRGIELRYSIESEPLGTGGAIRLAWSQLPVRDVLVVNGDTYVELDYSAMLAAHARRRAELTMAICMVPDASRYGALDVTGATISGIREKGQAGPGWINAGVYALAPAIRARFPARPAFSFEHDVLVPEVRSIQAQAFSETEQFIDIGVPDDYKRAQALLPRH